MFHSCLFCLHLLLPSPTSSSSVLLHFASENPGAIWSDILPSCTPLPPLPHANLRPHPQQPHTHPDGTCGPVGQQAVLLLQLLFVLPSLFLRLLPSLITQLPTFPLQLCEPCLPSLLPSAVPAAVLTLPCSLAAHSLNSLPDHGGATDRIRVRGHPELRSDGVSGHGPSVCPLPLASSSPSANNGDPTC